MADGQDSEVTVNTRALIDKVLARYSSEHTTLRELIQNASDAGATTVIIRFDTDPSLSIPAPQDSDKAVLLKHTIQHHTLKRLVVSNNGVPFTPADWSRLKSIADGNPDETKIGAFGVGFYSVFADCDEPFVVSGDRTMAFYWKGNTLSTKVANVPVEHSSSDTIFSLDYRQANPASPSYNPSKIPNLPTLCQFLATSLTFVGLQSIELHLDDFKVASITKKISDPTRIGIPSGLKTQTEGGLMQVTQITRQHSQIEAEWSNVIATAQLPPKRVADIVEAEARSAGTALKSFFSKFSAAPAKPQKALPTVAEPTIAPTDSISGESKGVVFLQVCTVEMETRVSRNFAAEIERATKKPPPRTTKIALLTSPYNDSPEALSTGSGNTADLSGKIFSEILPTQAGRIFIGFPTAQTTGYLAHVSAPSLIPTVERENIDLNARYISTWNIEILRVAGLACRMLYSLDMADVREKFKTTSIKDLIPRATFILQQYTATTSHPSTLLGQKIEEAFWNCSKDRSIAMLSSTGVMASKNIRMPAETLSFLGDVPMVPQELAQNAVQFMVNLHNRGFISELTMADIKNGLGSRALSEEELTEFLKWCGAKLDTEELDSKGVRSLFENTIANIDVKPGQNSGRILALGAINSYINATRITPTLPVPPETVPFAFSKAVSGKQLQAFGWSELSMVRWLRFMTTAPQLAEVTTSEALAIQVLTLTAKSWDHVDGASREAIVNILSSHQIMPTKTGMRKPQESYFPTVRLFDDLPTVKQFPGSKDKFLHALGVRKTVELSVVFHRMQNQDSQTEKSQSSNHADLIRYFASVIDELPKKDLERLQQTPFLPGEGAPVKQGQLFRAQDLYAPEKVTLSLGLVQVKLPFEFRESSREGALLLRLGLKKWPDASTIANVLHRAGQSKDQQLYNLALEYFLQSYYRNGYGEQVKQFASIAYPILPIEQAPFPTLVAPFQCFANEHAASFEYAILRADLRIHAEKLGVQQNPDIKDCVRKLIQKPPKTHVDAELRFSYLASRVGDIDQHRTLLIELSSAPIVPIFRKYYLDPACAGFEDRAKRQKGKTEARLHHYEAPETVFVGRDQEYRGILDYVQFGNEAQSFLLKAGAKHEPSSIDLASLLAKNPSRFLNTIGQDRYLDLLRKLAENAGPIWKNTQLVQALVTSRILLGYRDIKIDSRKSPTVEDDMFEEYEDDLAVQREYSLNKPNEIVIIDDVSFLSMFRDFVIAAPQEEQLEEFYSRFGVRKITQLVNTVRRIGVAARDQTPAQKLRKVILERARLFLHEHERDGSSKSIKHDAKWLSSNLTVVCVSNISLEHSLADLGHGIKTTRTAAIRRTRETGLVLNVTPQYDSYEVSRELIGELIHRPKKNDAIALERILTESLRRLQAKGINVDRILRKQDYEARIAKQREVELQYEEEQRQVEEAKQAKSKGVDGKQPAPPPAPHAPPATPDKNMHVPGAFNSPDQTDMVENDRQNSEKGVLNNWAKKLGFKNTPSTAPHDTTDTSQINRDLQATKSNIANAIKNCKPTTMANVNAKIHQDPTQLDQGGYCAGEQWENLHKAFTVPYSGRHVDVYFGKNQSETPQELQAPLATFLPVIFGLTSIFGVNESAVNIFVDSKTSVVAFNMGGSLFFNLAWFMAQHAAGYATAEGRQRALDSWFFTYCHELAHNLVGDHNARHGWYQQQIAIEFSPAYRRALGTFLQGLQISLLD
ncbi:hypothetical protein EJ04DRAFT_448831 [Polyplosphaeria fusca]|uniref:Sacsin/Nov domain-containing protein n=1 Tax=Polyplosphaeria fusca TaxID=682080 RepID=A0A9P4QPG6_9PLEO|nr:hypothetical protein EJ04DRAFT_448831 [Polyplosphaeria fusca]